MQSNWKQAFEQMLASEGGFTDDERDPGNKLPDGRKGSTMLGVTQFNWENHIGHQVTHDQMRKLTLLMSNRCTKRSIGTLFVQTNYPLVSTIWCLIWVSMQGRADQLSSCSLR